MKEKFIHFNFLDVYVSIRFFDKGLKWYNSAKKLFSGFPSSGNFSGKVVNLSGDSFLDFRRAYKQAIGYIIKKKMKSDNLAFIHASAVYDSNKIYIFLGKSGFGKSTACKILHQKGFKFITDDTFILDIRRKKIIVFPKPIELKKPYKMQKRFFFYFPMIESNEVSFVRRKLIFFLLKNKIKTVEHYNSFVKILKSMRWEYFRKLNHLDGVMDILKSTANLKNLNQKSYMKIIAKRGNDFYVL